MGVSVGGAWALAMSAVRIRNLWKEYDGQVVLERVNIDIPAHQFVTIVGPSGCGKTTFLRTLLGVERPTRGTIAIDGEPLVPEPQPQRGVVFQRYSVFPHLTVLGNVLIGLELLSSRYLGRLFGARRRAAVARADAALDAVGLADARGKYPAQLSGGMQQRLAIAQSIVVEPKILLLDEPFGALDPGLRHDMHRLIVRLWREHRMTVFMITHDVKEAFQLGTHLLVFDRQRHDPQAPERYGATVTYQIPLREPGAVAEPAQGDDGKAMPGPGDWQPAGPPTSTARP